MNWSKFWPSSDETEAQGAAACTRPGSATSALRMTPPPMERPNSAIRSSSTGTVVDLRSALTALITSAL